MKTTGIFTSHHFTIPFDAYGQEIIIYPFGDVHYNSPACDKDKFHEFCDKAEKNAYFIGMGDYLETLSCHERKVFVNNALHDSSSARLEELVRSDVQAFIDKIKFMQGRVLGIIGGNHYFKFADGTTSDHMIANALKTKYLGVNSLLRLILCRDKHHGHKVDLCLHHGQSGGRTPGTSLNKLQMMANHFEADIILQGHDHNRAVDYINRLALNESRTSDPILINKRILLARTGSFLKAYEENKPSYIVDWALPPSDLGVVKIILTPQRKMEWSKNKDLRWVDITATI